ncbi:hypothetical protein ORJ00_18450 [Rheinheimera baltica]|uniref:hypothetical protein n=2 Tax=Rheinheimera baltica TaxID=67576 RepID=UPI00273FC674|nr:hypothetical protein [Rheinheimera baltica]MDP5144732.1 hypothetical protein [Rheinheimera baltica]MDP5151965.1 hypothetical protein [Rheinheimera baltica]
MSGVILAVKVFLQAYGRALALALLLHLLFLTALLQTRFTPLAKPPAAEATVSYLYQPPPPLQQKAQALSVPESSDKTEPVATTTAPAVVEKSAKKVDTRSAVVAEKLPDIVDQPEKKHTEQAATTLQLSLAQRALNRAATVDPVTIEQTAAASYQQFLQAQQQPKITVEKRHQLLSRDPAKHMVRIREGVCVIGDPDLDGFEQLMEAKRVPCGDKDASSVILKQALEKHIKR